MNDSKRKKLPDEWKLEKLGNIFMTDNQQIDKSDPLFNTFAFIGMDNIESNTRRFVLSDNIKQGGDSTCFLFDDRHVLYGKLRPYLNKIYLPEKQGRCSMELLPLKPQEGFTREFIAFILQSEKVISHVVKHSKGGRMPRANMDKLMRLTIAIPSSCEERKSLTCELERKMTEIEKMRNALDKQLEAIKALPGAVLREVFDFE